MIKPFLLTAALCASMGLAAAPATPSDELPPYAGDVSPSKVQVPPPARTLPPKAKSEGMQIAPSEADLEKARADREVHSKRTTIEAVRDQDNRVTEYVVTPGSTQIPYSMQNQAERPIDSTPGGNSKSTLGTPKFIEFGW